MPSIPDMPAIPSMPLMPDMLWAPATVASAPVHRITAIVDFIIAFMGCLPPLVVLRRHRPILANAVLRHGLAPEARDTADQLS